MQSRRYSNYLNIVLRTVLLHIAEEGEGKQYRRKSFEDLSDTALAYSLYRYAENVGYKSFRVSDLKIQNQNLVHLLNLEFHFLD